MKIIKDADFRREIKSNPSVAYLFFGEEDYTKIHALKLARECIVGDPSLSMFNEMKLDALSYSPDSLMDMLASPPMMSDRKLILITGLDFNAMKQSELDELVSVLTALEEYDFNTVIISADSDRFDEGNIDGKRPKPSAMLTKLSEVATPVRFEKNSVQRLAAWAQKHYEHNGVVADGNVSAFTVEYCGRDMFTLAEEIRKISFYALSQGRTAVTVDDIKLVGVNSVEYDTFAFTNAICARQKDAALNILLDMKQKRVDPILIMGEVSKTVYNIVSVCVLLSDGLTQGEIAKIIGIHEYTVSILSKSAGNVRNPRKLLSLCLKADAEIKSGSNGYIALEKLICTM